MTDLVCDTSGLLALIDRADPMHADVADVVAAHAGAFVVSPLVLAELDYLIRARLQADVARTFAEDVALGAYDVAPLTSATVGRCVELDRRYADLGLGLTDCHVIVLGLGDGAPILTLDHRHFGAVTNASGRALRLLPADRP